jgi:hypothetical protein
MNLTISAPSINPLNAKLNPICHLMALLEAHSIPYISRIMVKTKQIQWYGLGNNKVTYMFASLCLFFVINSVICSLRKTG